MSKTLWNTKKMKLEDSFHSINEGTGMIEVGFRNCLESIDGEKFFEQLLGVGDERSQSESFCHQVTEFLTCGIYLKVGRRLGFPSDAWLHRGGSILPHRRGHRVMH